MNLDGPVSTIMTAGPETVGPHASLAAVQDILFAVCGHHVPVVSGHRLVGIVSSNDLRRAVSAGGEVDLRLEAVAARTAMTPDPVTITPSTSIRRAAELLRTGSFGSLPVVEDGELVGIVTVADVLGYVLGSG
jgi:CBS domain-containing protein